MNTAKKRQKLDNNIFQVQGIAQKYNCSLKQLDYQQEAALMSCIPLGVNRIEIQRGLTTSSTAIFVPFTTQELFQEGEALYYGLNALSKDVYKRQWWYLWASKIGCYESPCIVTGGAVMHDQIQA